ncbi:restriction endonuclease subunit S [Mastigocoleus sp. MO_188.B34]|uniref:restriction endonuclease subunit S n=1 Tax=Mastigocoleus sp. MO_188.B34 TaxID=3036635 RepID=UPI00261457C7|nr:restriction endonuclease subunit S [Mastigocoleus sp. MO_188.B34]MDJ0696037.1 restriction endonuclease subunit S [Mastigocoleus sp. MO_188.B34]
MSEEYFRPIWIKDVRLDWSIKRIKHATYLKARVGWHGLTSSEYLNQGVLLVTGTDFENGRVNWETCYRVSEERYQQDSYIQIQEGDLLITKDGTIGKVALVEGLNEPATLNSGIFVTRPLKAVYVNHFMYWLLQSKIFQTFIDYIKVGTTINHLYQNQLSDFAFPVPSLDIQKAIATFLDRKTAAIDELIAKKQRLIELLEEKRTALINHVVTKGLNPNVAMKDSGIPWIGEIPEHWKVVAAKRVASVYVPQRNKPRLNEDNGYPWITLDEIGSMFIETSNKGFYVSDDALIEAGSKPLQIGAVVTGCTGTFGTASITKSTVIINQQLQAYIPINIEVDFLRNCIINSSVYFKSVATATTIPYVNKTGFEECPVPLPPRQEQILISRWVQEQNKYIDRLILAIRTQINRLQEYRQSLITAAVTGKINVEQEEVA